jgi:predicted ribosomally synthesized peptide with nif11-like leader
VSVENLKKYGELCAEKEEVRKRAKEIGVQDMDGQIAYAQSLGLEISREDFEALAKEIGLDDKKELSEEDLKKVAGGMMFATMVLGGIALAAGMTAVGLAAGEGGGW